MCVCVEEEEEESYFHKRVGQIRDLNVTMLRRRLALKSFLTKTPFEALLPLQLIALAKYVSYTSLSLSLTHTHTHTHVTGPSESKTESLDISTPRGKIFISPNHQTRRRI